MESSVWFNNFLINESIFLQALDRHHIMRYTAVYQRKQYSNVQYSTAVQYVLYSTGTEYNMRVFCFFKF